MTEYILLMLVIAITIHELNKLFQTCLYANKKSKKTVNEVKKIVKHIVKSL